MSEPHQVFRRPPSEGWLVLSGLVPTLGSEMPQLAEQILSRLDLSRMPICLSADESIDDDLQSFLEDIEVLLNVPVTVILVKNLSREAFQEIVTTANMLVIVGGDAQSWIDVLEPLSSQIEVEDLLGEGRLIFAIGPASSSLGSWIYSGEGEPITGLGWLTGAIVLPEVEKPGEMPSVKQLLSKHKLSYALGLPRGAVLALGPEGEIEVWGVTPPSVALGIAWGEL
ncbi:MAG TPA: hypothetical protein G4O11_08905 [Anaerolineae bacterium]|nr:hypothetical protein [Anaerolineae bacterium]